MQVYTEYDIFEEVILFPDKYPNWSEILKRHAQVCLNLSKPECDAKLQQGEVLFEYIHASGGKEVVPVQSHFTVINEDPQIMLKDPRAAYILKVSTEKAAELSSGLGLVIQSDSALDDSVLVKPYLFKDLVKDDVYDRGGQKGWPVVLRAQTKPCNAMVIMDPYLLSLTNGLMNLLQLCDALLPATLVVPFHIAVVTKHDDRAEDVRNKLAGDFATGIRNLGRPYTIDVEVVFQQSEHYHRRRVVMNYANITCDKGFAAFRNPDGRKVATGNDVRFEPAFHEPASLGDSPYSSATRDLKVVKQETTSLAQHIQLATGVDRGSIKGACNADKTLKNRLINDV